VLQELVGAVLDACLLQITVSDAPGTAEEKEGLASFVLSALLVKSWAQALKHRSTMPE
jgi:hypothetical protein